MAGELQSLATSERDRLSRMAEAAEDIQWPACLAGDSGWRAANEAYQSHQRRLGASEMQALIASLNMSPPFDQGQRHELLCTAVELFLQTARTQTETRCDDNRIEVDVARCPLMDRFMDPRWYGLTACGCFARRKGWYDTLGAPVAEELAMCRKWGDPICEFVLQVESPAEQPELVSQSS
ncbi:MAG TPA: hypothetical protein VFP63_06630 [Dehalococcoidia bacterium]|nr:hypothetical protein [Dehalococcoidia bacterium]